MSASCSGRSEPTCLTFARRAAQRLGGHLTRRPPPFPQVMAEVNLFCEGKHPLEPLAAPLDGTGEGPDMRLRPPFAHFFRGPCPVPTPSWPGACGADVALRRGSQPQ